MNTISMNSAILSISVITLIVIVLLQLLLLWGALGLQVFGGRSALERVLHRGHA